VKTTESKPELFELVIMQYKVNGVTLNYESKGRRSWGDDVVLLDHAIDFTMGTAWAHPGYTIEKLFNDVAGARFYRQAELLILERWRSAGLMVDDNFPLDQYHTLAEDITIHLASIEKTKLLSTKEFPVEIAQLEDRVSECVGSPLVVRNPYDGQSVFHFRVIRPGHQDNNPLHRDVWLEDYDDCINLYIPIAGSNKHSSLMLIPGSHRWPESRVERTEAGAEIGGAKFNVPAVTAIAGSYEVVRPNPGRNEMLVFSPYLVHGGAVNLNASSTRVSIEIRLWRK
jgi:hypothetical protein